MTVDQDRRMAIAQAVFDRAAHIERHCLLDSLGDDYRRVVEGAAPFDVSDHNAGARFADTLVTLAANCLVRLADLHDDYLRQLLETQEIR